MRVKNGVISFPFTCDFSAASKAVIICASISSLGISRFNDHPDLMLIGKSDEPVNTLHADVCINQDIIGIAEEFFFLLQVFRRYQMQSRIDDERCEHRANGIDEGRF